MDLWTLRRSLLAAVALMALLICLGEESPPASGATLGYHLRLPLLANDTLNVDAEGHMCEGAGRPLVALVIEPSLAAALRAQLTRFETDFCIRGYAVIEKVATYATPEELRAFLASSYAASAGRMSTAIFVGDFPHAYQWVVLSSSNPAIPATGEEVLSLQYYEDLDGSFSRSGGYISPAGHPYSFDLHSGAAGWEIAIGVLPRYGATPAEAVQNLIRYFDKHHAYVSNGSSLPRRFLQVSEFYSATTAAEYATFRGWLVDGQYAWTPFSTSPQAMFYFNAPGQGLNVAQGYAQLSAGAADFAVLDAHGYWGASGQFTIARLKTEGIRSYFLWSNGCAVGNLDQPVNWLSESIYASSSMALVAKGTTNDSGGMGTNSEGFFGHNAATALNNGMTFGAALRAHVNVPLIFPWSDSREFHTGTSIVLGDPTLKLPGK